MGMADKSILRFRVNSLRENPICPLFNLKASTSPDIGRPGITKHKPNAEGVKAIKPGVPTRGKEALKIRSPEGVLQRFIELPQKI